MDLSLLWTIGIIHLVALISPGPDFAIVVKMASQQSRSVALACAAGISVAILVHTILSLTGVSLLIQSSHYAYLLVQLVGASYLGWMGIGALTSALQSMTDKRKAHTAQAQASDMEQTTDGITLKNQGFEASDLKKASSEAASSQAASLVMTNRQGFMKGLYTNLLNPKALVFFLTLFSALITPQVNELTKAAAAMLLLSLSVLWFGFLAIILTKPRMKLALQRMTPVIDTVVGALFISVALAIVYNLYQSVA
jgi:threonine efflux protein